MNVTLNDQGRKEFYFGREEVKSGHSDRTQGGEMKLLLLGPPGLWSLQDMGTLGPSSFGCSAGEFHAPQRF